MYRFPDCQTCGDESNGTIGKQWICDSCEEKENMGSKKCEVCCNVDAIGTMTYGRGIVAFRVWTCERCIVAKQGYNVCSIAETNHQIHVAEQARKLALESLNYGHGA